MSSVAGKLNIAAFNWSKENMLKKKKKGKQKKIWKEQCICAFSDELTLLSSSICSVVCRYVRCDSVGDI